MIQLGAILAVCWVYRERLFDAVAGLSSDSSARRFVINIVVAFLPAAMAGVLLYRIIKDVLFSPWVVAISFVVGGFLILLIERIGHCRGSAPSRRCRWAPRLASASARSWR